MSRTRHGVDAILDPENRVPDEIADSADEEDRDADKSDLVGLRQDIPTAIPLRAISECRYDHDGRARDHRRIEDCMVWREEGLDRNVQMRPGIPKKTAGQPKADDADRKIERRIARRRNRHAPSYRPRFWFSWLAIACVATSGCASVPPRVPSNVVVGAR